jgi:hypothetical protein
MGRKRYTSDLTDAEWSQLAPLIPPAKPGGRPKGEPSTIVNVRLPLTLLAQLDRYLDQLEWQMGLKANRGMITRRALELFLASHTPENAPGGKE